MQRVLIVDDDPIQLKLMAIRVRDAGYSVDTASCADEGLTKAKQSCPDAILSDVLMGEIDGFGFCRRLRRDSTFDKVPVILLSAHFETERDKQLALKVGAFDLLRRTPDMKDELQALRESLHGGGIILPSGRPSHHNVYEEHLRTNADQLAKLIGQVRRTEQRYRVLFSNARVAVSVLSLDGVVLEVNPRWTEILKRPVEEIVGHRIGEYFAADAADETTERYLTNIRAGGGWLSAVPIQLPSGDIIHMHFSITIVDLDGQRVAFALGDDVTEQLSAEHALKAAKEMYRSLIERLPDVVWTSSSDGKLTYVTPNVERMLGWTATEFLSQPPEQRVSDIHPEDRDRVREALTALEHDGKLFNLEYRRRKKDGGWLWTQNRATSIHAQNGHVQVDGVISDITERKRLEESLRQAQKMEAIGRLTGGIAHDFNNILATIVTNSYFLIDALDENDPRRADAEEIREAAERAGGLTRQLLAFSRRQVLEPTKLDLNVVILDLEKMLRRLIGTQINIAFHPQDGLGTVRADAGQIEQVIMNLVVNARDAMESGGTVSIATADVDVKASEEDDAIPPGRYVVMSVCDTGSGMAPETTKRLFEPFFTTKEKGKGTGLGLSTCYGIVKQSGGHISVDTEIGCGSTFKVFLPRVDGPPDVRRQATIQARGGHETILVIEDDPAVRTAVTRILDERGYHVLVAESGREAMKIAAAQPEIDLILSDVVMPDLSGPDVVAQLRKEAPRRKALFMSGYNEHETLKNGVMHSEMSFIPKPFSPEALGKKVREVLDV